MTLIAFLVGYLIAALPTAGWLGRTKGFDLKREGSRNPGANNALRLGGPVLAASVLVVEAAKGYTAVWLGWLLAGDAGAIGAGIGAVAGNVFNVWYRFDGGKGLGISLGVLARTWPTVLPFLVVMMIAILLITRFAGIAALVAIAGMLVMSIAWTLFDWPTGGIAADPGLVVLSVALAAIMSWKHWRDSPLNPAWHPEQRTPV